MYRPTSVTVFGALNLVFGAFGVLNLVITGLTLAGVAPGGEDAEATWLANGVQLGVSAVSTCLLLSSGLGLLRMRPWARRLAVAYSIFAIVAGVASLALSWLLVLRPMFDGGLGNTELTIIVIMLVIGSVIGFGYPALEWFFMTRPHVVAAFSGVAPAAPSSEWADVPAMEPVAAGDPQNPFVSPRTEAAWPPPPGQQAASESIVETFVPSKNGPALASYYLGLFSLFPCLGFPMGVAAVYLGLKGLRNVRENPAVRGGAHAWVGVICGSIFGLFNFALLILFAIGITAAALDGR